MLNPQSPNDEQLARRACHDPEAFAALYRRHIDRVYRYLLSRVGKVQDAQDLTAQTFTAAFEGVRHYNGQGVFAAWLLGIARRKAADYFRGSRPVVSLEIIEEISLASESIEDRAEQRLQLAEVVQAMRQLSPDRAEALALRVFGGLSAAEAGELMGKGEDAVNTLVHRAMRDLRERLVECEVNHDIR
jgi:RNA polymerase sigma-70 factor, ECF subfamily